MRKLVNKRTCASLAAIAVAVALAPACGENGLGDDIAGDCEAEIAVKADALQASVAALQAVSEEMQADLSLACSRLAGDDGTDDLEDDDLEAKCGEAAAAIEASLEAGATIEVIPAQCTINAEAQLDCEADCSVEGECDPGSVEVRCDPGELSVACEGSCEGQATCEGSADVSVACEGACQGTCSGSCSGICNGECDGECSVMNEDGECAGTCEGECMGSCSATCDGSCEGSCTFDSDVMVECDAELRCEGECMGTATAPKCEGELEEPECDIDADCQAGCEGQAQFDAECTPPTIAITGFADAEFAATVEANLPVVLEVFARAELAANAAGDVGDAAINVAGEIDNSLACAAEYGASFVADMQAAASASASVSVSFQASADVSGSATSS